MRIAIYGLSKTGTSALFALVRTAMPVRTDCYFEPGGRHRWQFRWRRLRMLLRPNRPLPLLVKFLPFARDESYPPYDFGTFDHSILIVRDPRDRLISLILYSAYDSLLAQRPQQACAFIDMLERKERSPESIGLAEILEALIEANGFAGGRDGWLDLYFRNSIDRPMRFAGAHPEMIELRYEDLIVGNLEEFSRQTGLSLSGLADVGPNLQRVVRTKGSDNWRDWFTPDDVALFGPMLQPYLDRYYPEADWSLNANPVIRPEHASRYVMRILTERRNLLKLGPWPKPFAHWANW